MEKQQSLNELIDKAAAAVGSDYKLAKAMGLSRQRVSNWRHGQEKCGMLDRARLAGFAKEDALQELVRAALDETAGTLRGEQLEKVLGKLSQATGAALHIVAAVAISLIFLGMSPKAEAAPALYDVYYVK